MTKTERQIQRLTLRRDRLLIRIYKQRANRQDERDYATLGRRIIELQHLNDNTPDHETAH